MEKLLKQLLDDLAAVADNGAEEIFDTEVRETMFEAVWSGFIVPKPGYQLPAKLGMFTDEANRQVRNALEQFITGANLYVWENNITDPQARLELIQNDEITGGTDDYTHDDFFGYLENVRDFL